MTLGKTKSNRSLPIDAMTSKVYATPEATTPSRKASLVSLPPRSPTKEMSVPAGSEEQGVSKKHEAENRDQKVTEQPSNIVQSASVPEEPPNTQQVQPGWFGWTSKEFQQEPPKPPIITKPEQNATLSKLDSTKPAVAAVKQDEAASIDMSSNQANSNKRTWLQMWGGADEQSQPAKAPSTQASITTEQSKALDIPRPKTPPKIASQASSLETSPPPVLPGDPSKSSGWIFWSREKKPPDTKATGDQPRLGELAISDTPSQTRPKRASISLPKDEKPVIGKPPKQAEVNPAPAKIDPAKSNDIGRPATPQATKKANVKQDPNATKAESANAVATLRPPTVATPDRTASPSPAPSTKIADNQLLPALDKTLRLPESPSILQQLQRLLYYTKEPELKHVSLVRNPPRIRNALAIGVHGYFPGTMVRTLLGQPTGTSIKFADMAAKSIRKWTNNHGYDCQVKTAALEGEGKIAERVELLWKLLLNWIDEIRKSDFVLVACHSQGVPVAIMLVSKLIQFGCISAARVGVCAMAGVNLGPFVELKSRWITGSAGELFEFSNPESTVSLQYGRALEVLLKAGVRLTLVGSIDDQLVSLESAIFSPVTHPHIYRAALIDSRVHAPSFLSHLVGFVLKLRNLGVQDHGLIRELSLPLAGSLYTGEGHSRIYDDEAVYDLAVSFALETTTLTNIPLSKRTLAPSGGNPYILPFAMRGILEEDFVKSELQGEAQQLLREFDEWKPNTKVLKDVKFRLEGVRSKL